jgi:hypothetical protein
MAVHLLAVHGCSSTCCSWLLIFLLFIDVPLLAVHGIGHPVGHVGDVIIHLLAVHGCSCTSKLFKAVHLLAVHGCYSSCCS